MQRVTGALYGHAYGDALGAPTEFLSYATIVERYGELPDAVRQMVQQQAQKRIGMRFVPTRTVSWDHRKLGGTY